MTALKGNTFNTQHDKKGRFASKGKGVETRYITKHPLYTVWRKMRERCFNKNCLEWKRYGGRGIIICKEWGDFDNFAKDMYPTYKQGLTLDRIDNDGNYEPENCRWATWHQQQNNRSNNHFFEYKGIADTLTNWASFFKIKKSTLTMRVYKYGWNFEKALFTPVRKGGGLYR